MPDERFLHGVDLRDWYPCWNLALAGRLWSPDYIASVDAGIRDAHESLRDTPIDVLRVTVPSGVFTPRATWYVWAAAIIRQGGRVGIGAVDTSWLPRERLDQILRIADVELIFEERRRQMLPDGASRLSSLYLAEDSQVGRAHIRGMLGEDVHILRVGVSEALRFIRCNTQWFDLYFKDPKIEYVDRYWSSSEAENVSTWEFLIEGAIEVDDVEGLAYLREHGAHLTVGKGSGDVS